MDATELRIGNLIYDGHECHPISAQILFEFATNQLRGGISINPIPLTEEWLLKLGFKKDEQEGLFFLNHIHIHEPNIDVKEFHFIWDVDYMPRAVEIRFVHELQALYFSLIKTELQIN